jgi:cation transport ATPase
MQESLNALEVLSAMITPAVLISACGTLIFSTSTRLARVVDRVRELGRNIESLSASEKPEFIEERHSEIERQLAINSRRSSYIQHALTSFYISLGLLVAATIAIAFVSLLRLTMWFPNILGIMGTISLFYGCIALIAEARLALRSVRLEMQFTIMLNKKYQQHRLIINPGKAEGAGAAQGDT